MSGAGEAPAAAEVSVAAEVSAAEYVALGDAARAALPLSQSRRKKLDKALLAHRRKAAKAVAGAGADAAKNKPGGRKERKAKREDGAAKPAYDEETRPLETPAGEKKRLNVRMADAYHPKDVEGAWYEWWDREGFFKEVASEEIAAKGREEKFVMVIPPPNVTGTLHLGHALMCAVEDALTRWHRMHGRTALWIPGVDHAGIATQAVVEKQLARAGLPGRREMGRERFVEKVWEWREDYGGKICGQLRRLGASLDWDREEFTMSDKLNAAVKEAFVRFYEDGLVYRDTRLVNWSCALKTAISDIEVDTLELTGPTMLKVPGHEEEAEFGVLTHFAYKIVGAEREETQEIVVATTRLETMLGDVAVAVHPDDARYAHLVGRRLAHPFVADRDVVVVADPDLVDMAFGTGAVKVTPAHDANDFACGRRHGLQEITVLTDDGCIAAAGGATFAGMRRYVARKEMEAALERLGLLRGKTPNPMALSLCSRSGDVIEPLLKPQWWVNCKGLAKMSTDAVRNGELKIVPPSEEATWFYWLDNCRDWCISRQLWWGHRIPAYKATVPGHATAAGEIWVVGRDIDDALARAVDKLGPGVDPSTVILEQDEDVLDTWFSSGLFPFSVFGWPDETPDMASFFPTSVLETGSDILFFWVARMVMMSLGLTGKLPFHTIMLHSMVRDKRGRKMSKSVGNVIDPLYVIDGTSLETLTDKVRQSSLPPDEIKKAIADKESEFPAGIPTCGADSLRMGLLAYMTQGGDINLDVARVIGYRAFGNKLWNATRFAISNLGEGFVPSKDGLDAAIALGKVTDRWILSRLNSTIAATNDAFEAYRFGAAVETVYTFWMNDLCAAFLENSKPVMKGDDVAAREAAKQVLFECLFAGLRLLHPMMPFITEELYFRLPGPKPYKSMCIAPYPVADRARDDPAAQKAMNAMRAVTQAIRSLGKDMGLAPQARPEVFIVASDDAAARAIDTAYVRTLALCGSVSVQQANSGGGAVPHGCVAKVVDDKYTIHVAMAGLFDVAAELAKQEALASSKRFAIQQIEQQQQSPAYAKVPEAVRRRNADNKASRQKELDEILNVAGMFQSMLSTTDSSNARV